MNRVKVAMIGVGNISGIYLKNITQTFRELELVGVCDLVRERAEKAQAEYGIPKIYDTMHDAFADPEVQIVLNLTRPYEHFEVSRAALLAEFPDAVIEAEQREISVQEGTETAAVTYIFTANIAATP